MTGFEAGRPGADWGTFDDLVRFETVVWNRLDEALRAEAGLTLGDLSVITIVADHAACRVSDLVRALAITVGGASQAADRVVRRELCERRTDPADARASIIALTPHGQRQLEIGRPIAERVLREHFSVLDPTTAQIVREALHLLRSAALE